MNDVSIPWHLVIPGLISLIGVNLIITIRNRILARPKWLWHWIALFVFFAVYTVILYTAVYEDISAQVELNKFDLDGDGFFGTDEQTEAQQQAMFRVTNDVGRNFSVYSGLMVASVIGLFTFVLGWFIRKIKTSY